MPIHHVPQRGAVGRVVAVAAAAAMAATVPSVPTAVAAGKSERAQWQRTRVYVQGDSLTVGSAAPLRSALGRKVRDLGVDAAIGRHTNTGLDRLRSDRRARRADIWVVALGTNDGPYPSVVRAQVRRSLRMAGPGRPVVWMTLRRPGGYARVNAMLRRLDRSHERLRVVDWARVTGTRRSLLAGDGVHATPSGYRVRAQLIADQTLELAGRMR